MWKYDHVILRYGKKYQLAKKKKNFTGCYLLEKVSGVGQDCFVLTKSCVII